jgi:rRNA processing protein Gar1
MNKISTLVVAVALAMTATPVISFAQSETHSVIVATDHGMRSSKLIGMAIYDEQGKQIGKIEDIMVKGGASEPVAVLSLGDTGSKMVGVPLSHVMLKSDKASMKATPAEMAAMPAWKFTGVLVGNGGG